MVKYFNAHLVIYSFNDEYSILTPLIQVCLHFISISFYGIDLEYGIFPTNQLELRLSRIAILELLLRVQQYGTVFMSNHLTDRKKTSPKIHIPLKIFNTLDSFE